MPVLVREILELLAPGPGQTLLDCTAGLGGHAASIAPALGPTGTVVLNDQDPGMLARAAARVRAEAGAGAGGVAGGEGPRVVEMRGNFADAPRRMLELGLRADLVLADLGFSSAQMDDGSRGLSFNREGPLDMRLDPSGPVTAAHLVNTLPEQELGEIIRDLGEENRWRALARKLVDERRAGPIDTTLRLASIVRSVVGRRGGERIDPATRTFQALRIAVNDELGSLRSLLESVERTAAGLAGTSGSPGRSGVWLGSRARVAIISFHSLEDRLVKRSFAELGTRGQARVLTRKPVEASESEQERNPRSRSARLRVVEIGVEGSGSQ